MSSVVSDNKFKRRLNYVTIDFESFTALTKLKQLCQTQIYVKLSEKRHSMKCDIHFSQMILKLVNITFKRS